MNKAYLLIAGAMLLAPAAHAQLADGSFEGKGAAGTVQNGGTPVTGYCYDSGNYGDGQCLGTSWTGSGAVASGNGPWGNTLAQDGNYFAFVQGNQAMSQTFTVASTGFYALSWFDAGRTNNGGPQTYDVSISGIGSLGSFLTDYVNAPGWNQESAGAVKLHAGTSYTLSFTGQSVEDRTSFIDNVKLNATGAVPEPATWALMIGGFGLAGGMMRRRASKGSLRHA